MTSKELNHYLYELTYNEYVDFLKNKYGKVPKDYFYTNKNNELVKTAGITRGKDGLYIHHVYECFFLGLSDPTMYILQLNSLDNNIRDAQKAENLVYCNLLEHLILHVKIALEYHRGQEQVGIDFITGDLNRLYELGDKQLIEKTYNSPQHKWKCEVYKVIKDDYSIYLELCKIIITELGISKSIVCNVTWYNTRYVKLYEDLGILDLSKVEHSIIDCIKKTSSVLEYRQLLRDYIKCRNKNIYFALLDKYYESFSNNAIILYSISTLIHNLLYIDETEETLRKLYTYSSDTINEYIALTTTCPIDILEELSINKNIYIKAAVMKNTNCPIDIVNKLLDELYKSDDINIREQVALHNSCPVNILCNLAKDKSVKVRLAVIKNVNVTDDIIDSLQNDSSKTIKKALLAYEKNKK